MVAASERHEHAVAACDIHTAGEQGDVCGRTVENPREIVGKLVFDMRQTQQDELDVIRRREPHGVSGEILGGEHRGPRLRRQLRAPRVQRGGRVTDCALAGQQAGDD